jgi:redox-sensitive bicupin YhaK (pirin superfamily)
MTVADARNRLAGGSVVRQEFGLGMPWPTVDPFLFCVHHLDHYPAGDGAFAPAASLAGRTLGNDFEGLDGWRMYHGHPVPGFPQHPHRGFETVTYVRRGIIDHSDSLGAAARFGRGDTQWLTAGSGIVHSEMFPLLDTAGIDGANTLELFQIWVNLPAADKMADPWFSMLWHDDVPTIVHDHDGHRDEITVVAGTLEGHVPPSPPPSSWASRHDTEVAIWHVHLEPGASWVMPPTRSDDTLRAVYAFSGDAVELAVDHSADRSAYRAAHDGARDRLAAGRGALVRTDEPVLLSSHGGADVLVLQGRPIGEPVAQYGPFVMNDRAGVEQAFRDYQRTQFGGWPWDADGPVHGHDPSRFARRPDGVVERPRG